MPDTAVLICGVLNVDAIATFHGGHRNTRHVLGLAAVSSQYCRTLDLDWPFIFPLKLLASSNYLGTSKPAVYKVYLCTSTVLINGTVQLSEKVTHSTANT